MMEINKQLAKLLLRLHGVDVSRYEKSFLDKALRKRLDDNHCASLEEYCVCLEQNNQEAGKLLGSLKISYSEFFRNPLTFAVLEQIILPALVLKKRKSKSKEIRVWSAACAAGQESYSLSMLLEELKTGGNEISYRIFATDQCEAQVNEARNGRYPAEALNNLNLKRVKQWITKRGDTYTVKPALKNYINFSVFDLFSEELCCPPESLFGDFDLVVCANLLFYYKSEYRKNILEKAEKCLADGGYLITGETERDILISNNFREVFPKSAIFTI